jgi:hypothetical protein
VKTTQDPFEAEFGDLKGPTHWPSLLPDQAPWPGLIFATGSSVWSTGSAWRPGLSRPVGTGTTPSSRRCPRCATMSESALPQVLPRAPRSTGFGPYARSSTD